MAILGAEKAWLFQNMTLIYGSILLEHISWEYHYDQLLAILGAELACLWQNITIIDCRLLLELAIW